ncbi:hypothetical protein EPR50_G00128550 [Perca flavescens]|uniref:ZP domain-containing protein n=1 Tax=Perca flavescens TaxID=8167 RepID=A0A484CQ20_PERFV|nr:hypothetical protein EPR50_G00128550 [Perca flavescens]
MAYRESRGSRILLSLGLLVFASSFCHCTKLTKLKALDELRENSTLGKSQAKAGDLRYGRLLIGQNSLPDDKLNGTKATKNFWDVDTDYQEDMGWGNPEQLQRLGYGFSKPDNAAVERLLLMDPKVECTGDSMKLQVQNAASTPGSLFFVDRGSLMSPLALSKLPPSCGYNIRSTRRDLVLVAPYDGCFVVLEEDSYVLPIRWLGLNVRMSCPLMPSSPNPPMVTCHAEGMVVKTGWTVSIAEININLNGNWEPLMKASSRCGFSVVVHPEGVVISVHYTPCMEIKDGMYTLELAGEGETKMSCPPLPWPPASGAPQQQPFYPQLEAEKQTAEPRPVWTKAPQGSEPVNPVLQYNKPSPMQQNGQLAWDINNSSGPDFMSHIGKYLNQQQNTPKAGELQQSNEASKSRLMHPKVKSETDRPLVPYNMLQDAKAQTYDKLTPNNASQPEDQQTVHSYVEPKSYVLLQHGPPDRGSNHSNESPLPSRDLVYDADLKAQNLARHHSSKLQDSQNVKPPQNPQHPKMLGQEMSHPLLDVNYIPRPDDKSSLPFISLDDPHSVPLPQDPFVNGAHLNPKFKDFWRPMTPLGSSQSIEPHVLVKAFQQSSAADQQADGLNQPNQPILQRGGNQRQK